MLVGGVVGVGRGGGRGGKSNWLSMCGGDVGEAMVQVRGGGVGGLGGVGEEGSE